MAPTHIKAKTSASAPARVDEVNISRKAANSDMINSCRMAAGRVLTKHRADLTHIGSFFHSLLVLSGMTILLFLTWLYFISIRIESG
jgi:hypothetical protein